jgi:hypothetical protein
MLRKRTALGLISFLVLAACGGPATDEPGGQAEGTRVSIPIVRMNPDLPPVGEPEIREIVTLAEKANPGVPLRSLEHRAGMLAGYHYAIALYDPHVVHGRVRMYRTATISAPDPVRGGSAPADPSRMKWRLGSRGLGLRADVCPVGQSFDAAPAASRDAVVTLEVGPEIEGETIVEIVDSVTGVCERGENPASIEAKEGGYEVRTDRGGEGSVYRVRKVDGTWRHAKTGGWIR